MKIAIKNNKIYIQQLEWDAEVVQKLGKNVLGMTWYKKGKYWRHELTPFFVERLINKFPEFTQYIPDEYKWDSELMNKYSLEPLGILMPHQMNALTKIAYTNINRFLFNHDCGTGKTLTSIEIINYLLQSKKIQRTIVLCPLSIIEAAWINDVKKFRSELKTLNLWDALKRKNWEQKILDAEIVLLNYEAFWRRADALKKYFQCIILDESSKLKSHKTNVTKKITDFCQWMPYVYELSGMPAPNSPLEYYSQIKIINPELFGNSYYAFREKYFREAWYKWLLKDDMCNEFMQKLSTVMEVVKKRDVLLDLPDYTIVNRIVTLSQDEQRIYNEMSKTFITWIKENKIKAASAVTKLMKLREITSGFIINEDETINFGNSKLKELEILLDEMRGQQVLIWYFFQEEGRAIVKLCKDLQIQVEKIDGTYSSQALKNKIVQQFKDGKIDILAANPASMGHGHTLVNCHQVIYYSQSHSLELYKQSFDRTDRKGQTHGVTYYNLLAKGTIDLMIQQILTQKKKLVNIVENFIQKQ